jgi:hypothetical protein
MIKDPSLVVPVATLPCDTVYQGTKDPFGYEVDPKEVCGCDTCAEACKDEKWDKIIPKIGLLDGFQVRTVSLMLFLVSVIVLSSFWTAHRKKIKDQKVELYSSFDSYDSIKKYL